MPATKAELVAAMARICDALMWMRGPGGELLYLGEKIPHIAFHLARAGCDVDPNQAIIKRRPIPNRPNQFAGMCDWVPVEWPDPEPEPGCELVSAVGEIDVDALDDLVPWHTKTRFEGKFS